MDVEKVDSGRFENVILNELGCRPHFIVILEPDSVQGWLDPADWLRRAIERSIQLERNVIPLLVNGFQFTEVADYLVGDLPKLREYNPLTIPHDYFDAAMELLKTRFLQQPTQQELRIKTAEEWFQTAEQLRANNNLPGAEQAYTKAIELNPAMSEAFCNRAVMRAHLRDYTGAMRDFDHAISLDPTSWQLYRNRGDLKQTLGDVRGAIEGYQRGFNGGRTRKELLEDY